MRRREVLVAAAWVTLVYVAAVGVFSWLSRQTGPALAELPTLSAVESASALVKRVASKGLSELWLPEHRATLDSGLLVVAGAWSKLSLGRVGVVDPLTAMRLPWILIGALAPLSLYLMLAPSRGKLVALAAALSCLSLPRFGHAVVVGSEAALVSALGCFVLAAHVRALGPARGGEPGGRATLGWAFAGALALGLGASLSLGVLWVAALVALHFVWARRAGLRGWLRRGRFPLPALLFVALPIAPLVVIALRPGLWKASPAVIARFFLAPLETSIVRADFAGRVVDGLPVPGAFAPVWLVHTLPLTFVLLGLAGVLALGHETLARRFASGSLRPPADRHAVGALALLGLCFGLFGPALTPDVLTTFPPRVELMLPFVAIVAAIGLGRLASLARLGRALVAVTLGALLLVALTGAPTASASASPLTGSARLIAARRLLPAADGSELAALASAIDALGRPALTLSAPPEVSPELWRVLAETRRMRTRVTPGGGGELVLARGAQPSGQRIAQVRRDGAVLWTLSGPATR